MSDEARRAIGHLKAIERAVKRAQREATKLDAARDDGQRMIQWGAVFAALAEAAAENRKLKRLVIEELEAISKRNRDDMTWLERRALAADIRRVKKASKA